MQIPGFDLLKELSRGPLTSVYTALQEKTGQIVLLKILHPQHARDREISKRFLREAEVIRHFDHKNIVKVYDHGTSHEMPFTVMEYVEGWNLRDFIKENHPLPIKIILLIFHDFLQALEYAHKKGVIHRDIKPSNILIGTDGIVKLTDFGLARQQDLSAITEQGTMIGTPGYTAPEILQGKVSNVASDIFSAGVTVYELLTGENPFKGDSIAVTIHNIMNRKLTGSKEIREDAPEWLNLLILRMTSADPEERPESVDRILADTAEFIAELNESDLEKYIRTCKGHEYLSVPQLIIRKPVKRKVLAAAGGVVILLIMAVVYDGYDREIIYPETGAVFPGEQIKSETILPDTEITSIMKDTVDIPYSLRKATDVSLNDEVSENRGTSERDNKSEPGGLYISAVPWAYIKINGAPQDTTPLTEPIFLPAGDYQIILENPSYKRFNETITVRQGQVDSINVILSEKYGYLQVSVVPWGEIYLNENFIETTPLKSPVRIEEGRYVLTVKNPYFKPHEQEVEIKPGETEKIIVYLE